MLDDQEKSAISKTTTDTINHEPMQLLEQRIMLDATLDWDLGTVDAIDGLTALSDSFSAYIDQFETLFGDLTSAFDTAMSGAESVFALVDGAPDTGVGDLDGVLQRIKTAVDSVQGFYEDAFGAELAAASNGFAANMIAYIEANHTVEDPALDFTDYLNGGDIITLFGPEAFLAGDIDQGITDFVTGKGIGNTAEIVGLMRDSFNASITGDFINDLMDVKLENVVVDGQTLVAFSSDLDFDDEADADTPSATIHTQVNLPEIDTILDALALDPDLRMALSQAISFVSPAQSFGFDITAISPNVDDEFGILFDNFVADPLFSLDGSVDLSADAPEIRVGMLQGQLDAIETAEIGLFFEDLSGLEFGLAVDTATFAVDATTPAAGSFDLELRIKEVGEAAFAAVVADQAYDLISFDIGGTISLATTDPDDLAAPVDTLDFGLDVILSSAIMTSGDGPNINQLLENAGIVFDVTLPGMAPGSERDAAEELVNALLNTGPEQIGAFLANIGSGISDFMRSEFLNIGIPMTGINLRDGFADIAEIFNDLPNMFNFSAEDLGFGTEGTAYELSPDIPEQEGVFLTQALLDALAGLGSLSFDFYTPSADPDVAVGVETVVVDLSGVVADGTDPNFLTQFVAALHSAFNARNWTVSVEGGKLNFASNSATNSFGLKSAVSRAGSAIADFSFADLGFGGDKLRVMDIAGQGSFSVINVSSSIPSFDLGTFDTDLLSQLTTFRLNVTTSEGEQQVDVTSSDGSAWTNLADLFADMNATFNALSIDMTASLNDAADGMKLSLDAGATGSIALGVDADSLVRALDLNSLMNWIESELRTVVPGATLTLADDGELIFGLPDVTADYDIATGGPVQFNASDLGLGDLVDLSLGASLAGSVGGSLSVAVGINLIDVVTDFFASSDPDASRTDAFLDNTFITDLSVTAFVDAEASSITGGADLGLAELTIGGVDPTSNFIKLNGQFDSTIVGQDDGDFSEQITLTQLLQLGQSFVSDVEGPGTSVTDLLGRIDLVGGVITQDDGTAATAGGVKAANVDEVRVFAEGDTLNAGEALSFLYVSIGDVQIDVGGVAGVGGSIEINALDFSIGNIFDILDEFAINLDAPLLDGMFDLQTGDIFDALAGIGDMLVSVGEMFADQFAFFDIDIPLLNFSMLDALDFSSDFLDALADLRLNPDFSLVTIENFLEDIFGLDTVTLEWDTDLSVLNFNLDIDFLKDFEESIAFNFNLSDILGAQLDGIIGPELAEFLTGFVDARGDGELVFDPDFSFNFAFGIDLSTMNLSLTNPAELTSDLGNLASVFGLSLNGPGKNDLQIKWNDFDLPPASASNSVNVSFDGAVTLQDALDNINTALAATLTDGNVTASYDETTGIFSIVDSNSSLTDDDDVTAMFGAATATSDDAVNQYGVINFDAGFSDFTSELVFDIVVNGSDPITLTLEAEAGRTEAEFVTALNVALSELQLDRTNISATGIPGTTVALAQLMRFESVGGNLELHGTNFAELNLYDAVEFSVQGDDVSHNIEFELVEIDASNAARLLGLETGVIYEGSAVSDAIYDSPTIGRPVVFMDTDNTSIRGEITVGAPDGLNLTLALGPLEASVVDGHAYVGSSAGGGAPAYIELGVNDIDGTDDGRYDLSHLGDIGDSPTLSYLDLFSLTADVAILIDLPFGGAAGLLDPDLHGFTYESVLLRSLPGVTLADFDVNDIGAYFEGDLIELMAGSLDMDNAPSYRNFALELPDFADFFANFNVLDFLNDPRAVLGGLDTILKTIQSLYDDYLSDINLPLIGDSLAVGVNFFDSFRYDIIEPALAFVETPDENGNLPTTVDVVNGYLNDLLNDVFGTSGQLIQASLYTEGTLSESYLYGAIALTGELFNEDLDIDFDFGVPGLNIGVDEGSTINLSANYAINLGFGIDKNGFFLLNDTDAQEIAITLNANANNFEGSMNVLNILGLTASASSHGGHAWASASLGADLFGSAGADLERDYSGITLVNDAEFENTVYVSQIIQSELITFVFTASASVNIHLTGMLTDPTSDTGAELLIGEVAIIPKVSTDFVFAGNYSTATGTFELTDLMFANVTVDASTLYQTLIKPILDPIQPIIDPLVDIFDWLDDVPMVYAKQALTLAFPIFGLVDTIAEVVRFMDDLAENNGLINFGNFDFGSEAGNVSSGSSKVSDLNSRSATRSGSIDLVDGAFGGTGLTFDIPLITDPFSAIDLLLGKFDQVDLVTAEFTLFDVDFSIDPVNQLLNEIGAPGWVNNIIRSVFHAHIDLEIYAGFKVGYDLSGIVNFMNTYDPVRLLDGVFIDSDPGSLVHASVDGYFSLNAGLAGLSGNIGGSVNLSFNDPNQDGKLRIPELIKLVETGNAEGDLLGYLFVGDAGFNAYLNVWAGINLPWPLPDLTWDFEVFKINKSTTFGGEVVPPEIGTLANGTTRLNVGAAAGGNMSTISEDGNDTVVFNAANQVQFSSNGQSLPLATLPSTTGGIVIPMGQGNNVVDMASFNGASRPTLTITGDDVDTIRLPSSGLHVVFAGGGNDTITANGNSSATYVIFGEEGSENINITGGNVIFVAGDDFGMRDVFLSEFATENLTEAEILKLLGINRDGTANAAAGDAQYNTGGTNRVNLTTLMAGFTAGTQLNAQGDDEVINLTTGNHIILMGNGDDTINVLGSSATGNVTILSGGGDDQIVVTAATTFVEGGAGEELIVLGDGNNTAYGWGAQGEAGDQSELMRFDGDDVIIGAAGNDFLYGQYGSDIISGGLGNDTVDGGRANDVLSGGVLKVTNATTEAIIDLTSTNALELLQTTLIVETEDAADGTDTVRGEGGLDVLFGGGGVDNLNGGLSSDILIGDFGKIRISANRIAETFESTNFESTNAGSDTLEGAEGNDILVAGGSSGVDPEVLVDTQGNNTIFGDFGIVEGTRILENVTGYRTIASSFGTVDNITAGRGNDVIFGGELGDTINSGMGADFVFGDLGEYVVASGTLTTFSDANDGADHITVGDIAQTDDKMDIVLGGGLGDTIISGDGSLALLGDYGSLKLNPIAVSALFSLEPLAADASEEDREFYEGQVALIGRLFENMTSVASLNSGGETVTSQDGTTYAVLGGGADRATLSGSGVGYVLGDDGKIEIVRENSTDPATVTLTSASDTGLNAGVDTITTGSARDVVIGGDAGDVIDTGEGLGIVLSDSGVIILTDEEEALPVSLITTQSTGDGADDVTGGANVDLVILGGGGDTADLEDGLNYVLGDDGSIVVASNVVDDVVGPATMTLRTMDSTNSGVDTITTGTGRDAVIGGDAGDTLILGDGDNALIGDSGQIVITEDDAAPTEMMTLASIRDGGDNVTTGSGNDLAILGQGNEIVDLGDGDNRAIGDSGIIRTTGALGDEYMETTDAANGGVDDITTGSGNDIVFGGEGIDTITTNAGYDIIVGDNAIMQKAGTGGLHTLRSMVGDYGTGDFLNSGAGNDIVLGGLGNDEITVGDGDDLALGDLGDVDFWNITDVVRVEAMRGDAGGNDTITGLGSVGDNILIGQAGVDTITGGESDDWIIGDLAEITLSDPADAYVGQSAMDRIMEVNFISPELEFNDILTGGAGNDFILGGFGADTMNGGEGEDFLFGDSIRVVRTLTPGVPFYEELLVETTFAFVEGGNDTLTGDGGADVMIGNLGPDLFVGNTEDDLLFSDAFAGTFGSAFNNFTDPTTHRELLTSNFAGGSPLDIVSNAQFNDAIGAYLSTASILEAIAANFGKAAEADQALMNPGDGSGLLSFEQWSLAMRFFTSDEIVEHLANLVLLDVDEELIREDILRMFRIFMIEQIGSDDALQMQVFDKMLSKLLDSLDMGAPVAYNNMRSDPITAPEAAIATL